MIYTATTTQGKVPATQPFLQRGLTGLTVSQISSVGVFGKPVSKQLAYDGYRSNIEAFIYATAIQQKVLVGQPSYPLPESYTPTIPLLAPQTVFKLSKEPSAESLQRLLDALKEADIQRIEAGRGTPTFTVKNPSWPDLYKISKISLAQGPQFDSFAQVGFAPFAYRLACCVDLFMRVNTYSFKKPDEGDDKWVRGEMDENVIEARMKPTTWYRGEGFDKDKRMKGPDGKPMPIPREPVDLSPDYPRVTSLGGMVVVAKPSSKPASTSFGSPSSVPYSKGILFPYFPGMLNRDTKGLRTLISDTFFSCMGSGSLDPKAAYLQIKDYVGTFAGTPQGIVMSHVLFGVKMALETQTQLFLLFDSSTYLGFCLLGEYFSVFAHGKWVDPSSETDLRKELDEILTHEGVIVNLAQRLNGLVKDIGGMSVDVEPNMIDTPVKLAIELSKLDIRGDSDESREISNLLRKLSFPKAFRRVQSPQDMIWALEHLTTKHNDPLPLDLPVYIPISGWKDIGTREYHIIASFGPRSFSFRNSKGVELSISKAGEPDPFEKRDSDGKLVHDSIIIMEKTVSEALKDWRVVKEKRLIKADYNERAKGSRNVIFRGKQKDDIILTLKNAATAGLIGVGIGSNDASSSKRTADDAFGSSAIDDLF